MSYIVEFDEQHVWGGANWVYRELLRRAEAALDVQRVPTLVSVLRSPRAEAEKVLRLGEVPVSELTQLLEAARKALGDTERAGPSSFAEPRFFPGFVDRMREFVELLSGHVASRSSTPSA